MTLKVISTLAFVSVFAVTSTFGQSTNDDKKSTDAGIFSNLNAGFGLLYGGYGLNFELGKKHFSGYAAFGYATRKEVDHFVIKPTYNYHAGLRYYFDVNSEVMFPRVGLGFGWITNYYSDKITNLDYDQSAYGLTVQFGSQFYAASGIVVSLDLAASSKALIASPLTHPHFFPFYLRPCVGIGFDLERLFKKDEKKNVQNKAINPFG